MNITHLMKLVIILNGKSNEGRNDSKQRNQTWDLVELFKSKTAFGWICYMGIQT